MSMVKRNGSRNPPAKTNIGQQSGRLVVIDSGPFYNTETSSRLSKRFVLVRCSCSFEFFTREVNIIRGLSTRCRSCKNKEHGPKLRGSDTGWNGWHNRYRQNARNRSRNIPFELTVEDIKSLCSKDCYYCDGEPERRVIGRQNIIYANGIDRIDPSEGYTVDNCQPCCTICNRMKWDMSEEDFVAHISKIANRKFELK